jgi:hypothetical protein
MSNKTVICWRKIDNYYIVICKDKKDKIKYFIKDNFTIDNSKTKKISEDDFMVEFINNVSEYNLFSEDCNISKRFNNVINTIDNQ